ncbi:MULTISPECIES: aminoglycoside phosphotransferase family protein [Streptosporangium]|uniref:Aminoglycoside phosphotransferase (APT) family kinase protein n=1 Tax=Streptosporangium brasiliense TaxID=47480 RepID=A0ABT9RFU8_9ACTN|nr:aminoglycoside phosphotransferase family protein [Streptosporangium brasiliense]MDP9868142.1 aminoglycoside phosphotransferase (APT) family kinase protein [Streptosporangium brasiliense]
MDVTETRQSLLGRLLPDDDLPDLPVHRGQFHDVVIGAERVVCFARTGAAGGRLPQRAAVLRTLSGLDLGVRTPEPLAVGDSRDGAGVPYLLLGRIPGAPLAPAELRSGEVAGAVAAQYAALFTRLAAAGSEPAVREALPRVPRDRWRAFAGEVRAELFTFMSAAGRERAERELAALRDLPHLTSAVVHGDLGGENVLWERRDGLPRLSGVVDWDDVCLGDQAEDLAAVGASYGTALLEEVLSRIGARPGLTARISAIRGTFALQQALYAARDGDREEMDDGLSGYRVAR